MATAFELSPELRGKFLFSPDQPQRTLTVGTKLGFVGDRPHVSCSISFTGDQFTALTEAVSAKLGRQPAKKDVAGHFALWAMPDHSRRMVVVAKNLTSASDSTGVAAIDELKTQGSK